MSAPQLRFKEFFGRWQSVHLGKVTQNITSGSRDWAQHYSKSGSKFIRMTNLSRDGIQLKLDDLKFVDVQSDSSDGQRTSLAHGDILISITAELGKIGWVPPDFGEAYINQHTALVRINHAEAESRFIAHLLSTSKQNKQLNRMNDSGAKAGLNLPTIKSVSIAIPTLPEQTKIANFLTAADEKISQLTQKRELLTQYKKGVMQQIFSQELRFKDDEGREFPEWEETTIGNICNPRQWTTISASELRESGFPVYGANGFIGYFDSYNHENETVAVTCRGATCGEVSLIPAKSYITGNSMCLDDIKSSLHDYKFIYYAMKFRGFKDVISGSAQPQIVGSAIRKVEFHAPKLLEQTKIANFLIAIDDKIANVQAQLAAAKQYKQGLLQQMFV